jgi:hypothetical protein
MRHSFTSGRCDVPEDRSIMRNWRFSKRENTTKSPRLQRALNGVLTIAAEESAKQEQEERKRRDAMAAQFDKALTVLSEETVRDVLKALLSVANSAAGHRPIPKNRPKNSKPPDLNWPPRIPPGADFFCRDTEGL